MLKQLTAQAGMQVWDLDYLSTSDEEDNDDDSESSSSSDEEIQAQLKRRKKKEQVEDVVDVLIKSNSELYKSDVEARLRKLKMRRQIQKKIMTL